MNIEQSIISLINIIVNSFNVWWPVVTGLGGALLTYFITEKNNKNQFKRENLLYLIDNSSEYLILIKKYDNYVKKNQKHGLSDIEEEEANEIAFRIDILQNRLEVLIKDNIEYKDIEDEQINMSNNITKLNKSLEHYNPSESVEYQLDLQEEINNYSNQISELINETF